MHPRRNSSTESNIIMDHSFSSSSPEPEQPQESYLSIKEMLQKARPCDLIAFKGSEGVSDLIAYMEKRMLPAPAKGVKDTFSHVGMVISREIVDHPLMQPGKLYIWESTISGRLGQNVYDIDHPNETFLGVIVRPLEELLEAYDDGGQNTKAYMAWCPLRKPPRGLGTEAFKTRFNTIFQKYNGRDYNANALTLFGAIIPGLRKIAQPIENLLGTNECLFCSELVATVWRDLGIIPSTIKPVNVVPMDLLGCDNEAVPAEQIPRNVVKEIYRLTHSTSRRLDVQV